MYVAGNLRIEHELSLLNQEHGPSPERYENILSAESVFCDLYKGAVDGLLLDAKASCNFVESACEAKKWGLVPSGMELLERKDTFGSKR